MIGTSIPGIPGTLLLYASICHQHRGQRNVYLMLPTYFCPHLDTLATPHSKHGQGKKILGLSQLNSILTETMTAFVLGFSLG